MRVLNAELGQPSNSPADVLDFLPDKGIRLTDREREVFKLLIAQAPLAEIAERLDVSVSTARVHAHNIARKYGAAGIEDVIEHAQRARQHVEETRRPGRNARGAFTLGRVWHRE